MCRRGSYLYDLMQKSVYWSFLYQLIRGLWKMRQGVYVSLVELVLGKLASNVSVFEGIRECLTSALREICFSLTLIKLDMGRGVSSGGGQSSLGYLFGGGEDPKPAPRNVSAPPPEAPVKEAQSSNPPTDRQPVDAPKQTPAGGNRSATNNYFRAEGQNCGNFITDRPSTKVAAAPGGGSSLGYLFGGDTNKSDSK